MLLTRQQWFAERDAHRMRLKPFTEARLQRSTQQIKHPVYDFLFEYYPFRPAHLLRWSPGVDVLLQTTQPEETDWPRQFQRHPDGCLLTSDSFPEHRREFLQWVMRYLQTTMDREPLFGCFGLHEWAMVYKERQVRHSRVPLRLSREETDSVVENARLCCTHYDAYRFFTANAAPLNRHQLRRELTTNFDQPACVHANMDLYKWVMKLAPYTSSALAAEAFELAVSARELDMRASPYDLREFGFTPICIETKAGRDEYIAGQQALLPRGQQLRQRLLLECKKLVANNGQPDTTSTT